MVKCGLCRFFQPLEGKPVGQCRREAPRLLLIPDDRPNLATGQPQRSMSAVPDAHPPVSAETGWCGHGESNDPSEAWKS